MSLKKIARVAHRWLGLTSGLIIFIVGISGCIYVFQNEIKDATQPWRKIEKENKPVLAPSAMADIAQKVHPKLKITRIVLFNNDLTPYVLISNKKEAYTVFINPYSGVVIRDQDNKQDFFITVLALHRYLLLPKDIGSVVVGTAVLIYVFILITGICIWWPKRKTQIKRSLTIKLNGRWRKVNYDLHSVLGIYAFLTLFIIAITGLSFSFDWVKKGIYNAGNLGTSHGKEEKIPKVEPGKMMDMYQLLDLSYQEAVKRSPDSETYFIIPPKDNKTVLTIRAYDKALLFYNNNRFFFDPETGVLLKELNHVSKSNGLKLNEINYDVHTGQILGITGKIIVFFTGLIAASLPVTGFLFWLGKKKTKKKKNRKNSRPNELMIY